MSARKAEAAGKTFRFERFATQRKECTLSLATDARKQIHPPKLAVSKTLRTAGRNNDVLPTGSIEGSESWVEGCRISAPLAFPGRNVVVGVDVCKPLSLPEGGCLGVIEGTDRHGARAWFVRCYGVDDTFKDLVSDGPHILANR